MAQRAFALSTTRVIRLITIDDNLAVPAGYFAAVMDPPIDLGNGPWKLDGNNLKVQATQAEYRASGFDEDYNAQQEVQLRTDYRTAAQAARTAWRAVANAAGTPSAAIIKAAATAQDDLNTATARIWKATLA